ncbi:NfeD family protein [Amphritea balenae]|nr:nodulation protein NfeD [Amphritea balenae]GGK79149.1 serine protease [Amphritea balenae]
MRMRHTILFNLLCLLVFSGISLLLGSATLAKGSESTQPTSGSVPQVWTLTIAGGIGPASSDLVIRTIDRAAAATAEILVIQLDTPGGLDKSMRAMIQHILSAPIPVVTYVSPQGARAASAGTYILYASHVAAMAPATNLGAASPVQLGAPGMINPAQPQTEEEKKQRQQLLDQATTMQRKIMNDAVAYIRGLADVHGRNADWAEQAVREAVSIDSGKALELKVIDIVASDLNDLLQQLDGRVVRVANHDYQISTVNNLIVPILPDWRARFLLVITNPNIAYILLMIGFYGLLLEFYNPGFGLPGVVGAICMLTGLYALQLLPISYTGLGLILLGVALMAIEALTPSIGVLGFGGAVAFVIGSIMLMDTDLPGYQIATPVIALFTFVTAGLSVFVLGMALKARRSAVVSGVTTMLGETAIVLDDFSAEGRVTINGETWNAWSEEPLKKNDSVNVVAIEGLILRVEKQQPD